MAEFVAEGRSQRGGSEHARLLELSVPGVDSDDNRERQAKPWHRGVAQAVGVLTLIGCAVGAFLASPASPITADSSGLLGEKAAVSLFTTKRICHERGGCECMCEWANAESCLKDDGKCCFSCCCQGDLSTRPAENSTGTPTSVFAAGDEVKVQQVSGPALPAVVQSFMGDGMYSVVYSGNGKTETASEMRLAFQHSDRDRGAEPEGTFDLHKHGGSKGSGATVLWVILVLILLAALAGFGYFAYFNCRFAKRLPIRDGAYVVVTGEVQSDNKPPRTLKRGDRGQVIRLDRESATIDFYDYETQVLHSSKYSYLQVSAYGPVSAPARLLNNADRSCMSNTRGCFA